MKRALAYYESIQNEDGGWPYQNPSAYGTDTDANSTAVTIQAIIAAGQDPAGDEWATAEGSTPLAALEALQNESGAFAWQAAVPDDNLLATVQALPAVAGKAFPFVTMAVGEAAGATPSTVPETGGAGINLALVLARGRRDRWPGVATSWAADGSPVPYPRIVEVIMPGMRSSRTRRHRRLPTEPWVAAFEVYAGYWSCVFSALCLRPGPWPMSLAVQASSSSWRRARRDPLCGSLRRMR